MQRIDRYILQLLLTLFGFFALVLVSVYWINRTVNLFDDLLQDGQTALVVLEFTLLTLPLVISVTLPVAAFVASAYGTNRMAGESELVAIQAAGVSPWRLARPVLVFGLLVGLLVAILVHSLVPLARARLSERQYEIASNAVARFLRPGEFQFPADGITLFIRDIAGDQRLLDVFIEDARDPKDKTVFTAEEALVAQTPSGPVIVLLQGMAQNMRVTDEASRLSVTRFKEFSYDIGALINVSDRRRNDLRDYSTPRLLSPDQELLDATGATPGQAISEAHERIAQPLLSPVAAMIGFATLLVGGYSRFGVWRQVLVAIVLLIVIQFMTNAAADQVARMPGLWPLFYVPALTGSFICAVLLWLATSPQWPFRSRDKAA